MRVYHGQRDIPKAHVARMRLSLPATTDYWMSDARGEPLFVVTAAANASLVSMLPKLLDEVRRLVGERRVTVVFDRGGWSLALFATLVAAGFDILAYRKGRFRPLPRRRFQTHTAVLDGRTVTYQLAGQCIRLLSGTLRLRQVTRLAEHGHQTPVVISRRDLPAVEVAYRMFERWRQENFFKYLREEYALDALIDYASSGGAPPSRVGSRSANAPTHRGPGGEARRRAQAPLQLAQWWPTRSRAIARAVVLHYRRADDEGRTLVQTALASAADIIVGADKRQLRVLLAPMSSAHRTRAIAALCNSGTILHWNGMAWSRAASGTTDGLRAGRSP